VASSHVEPETSNDPRAWRASTIDPPASWTYPIPDVCLSTLENSLDDLRRHPRPATELRLPVEARSLCAAALGPVAEALESGRGFAVIEGLPTDRLSVEEARGLYWLVGQMLGEPVAQNVDGTLLYDVRDTGKSVAEGARFSVTNYESSFHTDNSFGDSVVDYVGLLCLKTAKSGGVSQNVSGHAACDVLRGRHPKALETLEQPFHVDRRGGVKPGETPTTQRPVIEWDGPELTIRFLRYWIEAGHQKVGQPLSASQVEALDVLDEVLLLPELRVEFMLKPGQMYFINNRWILHNRTAFEDHSGVDQRRHLVRLWLERMP
jgi:alpha-ketoglutarate-dependent taurine dioxygenase